MLVREKILQCRGIVRSEIGREPRCGILIVVLFLRFIRDIVVHLQKAAELRNRIGGAEEIVPAPEIDRCLLEHRGAHLAGKEPVPDQLIQREHLVIQILLDCFRREPHRRRADCFVRILRRLSLLEGPCLGGKVLFPVIVVDVLARFLHRVVAQPRGIRPHIGDETNAAVIAEVDSFIQFLRQHHCPLGVKPEAPCRFLLEGAGNERRAGIPPDRLPLDIVQHKGLAADVVDISLRRRAVMDVRIFPRHLEKLRKERFVPVGAE